MNGGPRRDSLRRQVALRFVAVFLVIGGISAVLSWFAWRLANDRFLAEQAENDARAVETRLNALIGGWRRETGALVTQITFNRMLEAVDEDRWLKLRAYLEALGDNLDVAGLVILDKRGQPVFHMGRAGPEFATHLSQAPGAIPDWYPAGNGRNFFRILEAPLWLGLNGGHGRLVLLKAMDNALMATLATPRAPVRLAARGIVLASSRDGMEVGEREADSPRVRHTGRDGGLCHDIPLGNPAYRLHVEQALTTAISPNQFALAALALTLVLGMSLYAVFGGWLRRNLQRVEHLSGAVETFRRTHGVDDGILDRLGHLPERNDELRTLGDELLELMRASQARDEESHAYLQTLDILEEAVVEADRRGQLLRHSPAWEKLVGRESRENLYAPLEPEDREALEQQLAELFSGAKNQVTARLRVATPQRAGAWLECRFVPVDHPVTRIRGVLRDVTQIYLQEKHITHMALHDALTHLPNRILLEDRIKIALRVASRERHKVGIGFIDLDHFKNVNDALGHKFGDKLLVGLAENLRNTLRGMDTLARWGGDEFVVLLPGLESVEDIRHVADKLVSATRDAVRIEGQTLPVTFSVGFSVFPDDGDNMEALLSQADRAMFYAKSQGRNTVQFYADMTRKGLGRKELYIQSRLGTAIAQGQIQTWFQPLVDGASGRIVGLEALARWHDAELGWIPPTTFIPMAEKLGLIVELGHLVLTQSFAMGRRLLDTGHDLLLSVNISKRQLYMPECTERLLRDARAAGIPPQRIMLEITESLAMSEVDYAMERLRGLHGAGFKLAIDDFGVGYSSLSQLHEMPVDELKIDMSFTHRVLQPQGARLIEAIAGLARALDLSIVAEGVEDGETARRLVALGVGQLQGYHFGRPMPAAEFEAWLASTQGQG